MKSSVPEPVRQRGHGYWRDGSVEIVIDKADRVEAIVEGTVEYETGLYWNESKGVVDGVCSCPYFVDRSLPCKHLWALILDVDESGGLTAMPDGATVELRPAPERFSDLFLLEALDRDPVSHDDEEPGPELEPAWQRALPPRQRPDAHYADDPLWFSDDRRIVYRVDSVESRKIGEVVVDLYIRDRRKDGSWGALRSAAPERRTIAHLPNLADRQLLSLLVGGQSLPGAGGWPGPTSYGAARTIPTRFTLPAVILPSWIRTAASTGRLAIATSPLAGDTNAQSSVPNRRTARETVWLEWDPEPPWRFALRVVEEEDALVLTGELVRRLEPRGPGGQGSGEATEKPTEQRLALGEPHLFSAAGLVFAGNRVAELDDGGAFAWIPALRREPEIRVPAAESDEFIEAFLNRPRPEACTLPDRLQVDEVVGTPRPVLALRPPKESWLEARSLYLADLTFDYGLRSISTESALEGLYDPPSRRFVRRDRTLEAAAARRLLELGAREEAVTQYGERTHLLVPERRLKAIARALASEDWRVEISGQRFRTGSALDLSLQGSIDWFDLSGSARFDDASVGLPSLLAAVRRGERTVVLDDGSVGFVPDAWRDRLDGLAHMAAEREGGLRFGRTQVGLIDALLAAQPEIRFDDAVARARRTLERFEGLKSRRPPRGFRGALRRYQEEGLGRLHFLRRFGFGGCLADDMGLGKTVQVLALLEARREKRHRRSTPAHERPGPSLVVVPKSIVFNWQREAERFAPRIALVDYTGPRRVALRESLHDADVVLTTYGTVRRDIGFLRELDLDYAILDEAQAIKNPKSATAKACRLLRADHRLALTGTPVENHVGELMSLLDFLNPGLFGPDGGLRLSKSAREARLGGERTEERRVPSDAASPSRTELDLALIAGAVRPFILRRTKAEVAPDLPDKVEQTLYCELAPRQRGDYDRLLAHYRNALLGRVDDEGLGRSKIHVLEALLRLRQAACHPGLLDDDRVQEGSAKLDTLLPQLEELIDEGHKALVFSQFTSMLAILRTHLDGHGIRYEYLDGATRDRERRVERFQQDPTCPLFLISLKAGGVGLNLTAAEYVFLLDPWWNPAVEAQAVDRTHRIGQTRPVFAYSLIARDTIEEKILALQEKKRALADALVRADQSLLRTLTREELADLLSA